MFTADDFVAVDTQLTFSAGEANGIDAIRTISITINDDNILENQETVRLTFRVESVAGIIIALFCIDDDQGLGSSELNIDIAINDNDG